MVWEVLNRVESVLYGFSSSIVSVWNIFSQFGFNWGSSDFVIGGVDSMMSVQDFMMVSCMCSVVESYVKVYNISNEQVMRELVLRSINVLFGFYGDVYVKGYLGISVLGNGGGVGFQVGVKVSIDGSDFDLYEVSSGLWVSYDVCYDIDVRVI